MHTSNSWRMEGRAIRKVNHEINRSEVQSLTTFNKVLGWISIGLSIFALAAGIALLLADARPGTLPRLPAAWISASPLLSVGAAFLIMQSVIRPRPMELLKNVLLAATFLLWGAIQFMPRNATSLLLGDVVIALYVVDLAWVILGSKNSGKTTS